MRRLAAEPGVEAMSLYNHVANKADLFDGMTARVFENISPPDPGLPWQKRLRLLAEQLYAAFTRHSVVMRALAAEQANPRSVGALKVMDALLETLLDAGLDERAAARGYRSVLGLVFGTVLTDTVGIASTRAERTGPAGARFTTMVTAVDTPSLHRILPALAESDCVQDFAFQLDLLIAGQHASVGCRMRGHGQPSSHHHLLTPQHEYGQSVRDEEMDMSGRAPVRTGARDPQQPGVAAMSAGQSGLITLRIVICPLSPKDFTTTECRSPSATSGRSFRVAGVSSPRMK